MLTCRHTSYLNIKEQTFDEDASADGHSRRQQAYADFGQGKLLDKTYFRSPPIVDLSQPSKADSAPKTSLPKQKADKPSPTAFPVSGDAAAAMHAALSDDDGVDVDALLMKLHAKKDHLEDDACSPEVRSSVNFRHRVFALCIGSTL